MTTLGSHPTGPLRPSHWWRRTLLFFHQRRLCQYKTSAWIRQARSSDEANKFSGALSLTSSRCDAVKIYPSGETRVPDPTFFFIKDRGVSEKRVRGFAKQGHLMKQTNSQEQGYSPARGRAKRRSTPARKRGRAPDPTIFFHQRPTDEYKTSAWIRQARSSDDALKFLGARSLTSSR